MTPEPVRQRPRRWRRLLVAAGFLLVLAIALLPWLTRDDFSHRFARVRIGMSREEVHRIMGCPPGEYGTCMDEDQLKVGMIGDPAFNGVIASRSEKWQSRDGSFTVSYCARDGVIGGSYEIPDPPSLWERFKHWLSGLLIRWPPLPTTIETEPMPTR